MKLVYSVEMQDIVAFNQYALEQSGNIQTFRRRFVILLWVIVIFFGLLSYRDTKTLDTIITWSIFAIAFSIWVSIKKFRVSPKKIRKIYSGDKNKGVLCQHELELVDDGLIERTSVGEQKMTFSGIEKIDQTDTHGFIFIGTMQAHTIPRDGVMEGDFDEFMKVVTEKWKSQLEEQS